jgi:ArsR family transcriptional regulator, arsenate/arsenite/antimonite-responsive transcriptional repressor
MPFPGYVNTTKWLFSQAASRRWAPAYYWQEMAEPAPIRPIAELPMAQPIVVAHPRNVTLEVLRALGHPLRLQLVALIAARGPICTCHLEEELGQTQPQISKHLGILRQAGLIEGRRDGRWVYHTVNAEALDAARDFLEQLDASMHRPHPADDCGPEATASA